MNKKTLIGVGLPPQTIAALRDFFAQEIYEFRELSGAQDLIRCIKECRVSLIFVHNVLPDLKDCQELCIALRAEPNTETVPVIVLSSSTPISGEKISMLKSGLIDGYLDSSTSAEEIAAYANVFLQRQALEEELELKNELLNRLSITDELTALYNRRHLIQRLDEELRKIKRYNYPLSCIMLDIDHFKEINDTYGHSQGDMVIQQMAEIIKKTIRSIDITCRYGGEEFIVILPFTTLDGVSIVAERLRAKVQSSAFGTPQTPLQVTASLGFLSLDSTDAASVDSVFMALDKKLYEAKNTGRNRMCGAFYKDVIATSF